MLCHASTKKIVFHTLHKFTYGLVQFVHGVYVFDQIYLCCLSYARIIGVSGVSCVRHHEGPFFIGNGANLFFEHYEQPFSSSFHPKCVALS